MTATADERADDSITEPSDDPGDRASDEPCPACGGERTLRIKYSATGHCAVTHPAAPLGRHGATITHEVTSIPRTVSTADAVRRYAATAILPSYGTTVAYADLGSRILT